MEVSRRDVVVVFDVLRYQKDTFALAESVRDRGATIVLVTDPWLSPIADIANNVLTFDVDGSSPHGSIVGCVALIEMLIASIAERLGRPAGKRASGIRTSFAKATPGTTARFQADPASGQYRRRACALPGTRCREPAARNQRS